MPRRIFLEREIKSLLAASDSMWPKPVVDHMEGFGQVEEFNAQVGELTASISGSNTKIEQFTGCE